MNTKKKIYSFTDLEAWRESHKLVLMIYAQTKSFPSNEQFGLVNQLRRAATSVTSNIAEGFSKESYKEKVLFYRRSLGSLTEIQNQILVARDVGYIIQNNFSKSAEQTVAVSKLLNGLIKKSKEFYPNS